VAYTSDSARRQLLEQLGQAVGLLSLAVEALGEAYEAADEQMAAVLEEQLFRPAQRAYGRARQTRSRFSERHHLEAEPVTEGPAGAPSADPRIHLERAIDAIARADEVIAEMQDSMLPVEVGDRELRDGLTEVRELVADVPREGRQLLRLVGR